MLILYNKPTLRKGVIDLKKGIVIHYYDKLGVGIVKLSSDLKLGESLVIKNKQGKDVFSQDLTSMQVNHQDVSSAKKGDEIGVKLNQPVKKDWQVHA